MFNDEKEKIDKEPTTENGEFIASYFAWVDPIEQRERVKRLEKITKK